MLAGPASNAAAGSLYSGPGPRPGPPILYQPLADAPQLQNSGVWQAPPILVSGASAYRDGEFLYQDFLYDDNGALGNPAQNDPRFSGNSFSRPAGTYTYPTDTAKYANNAADIVELRLKPLAGATAFRITLNTIKDADAAATTIALGGTAGLPVAWPHGANVSSPADLFLTVHGNTAELISAASGQPVGATPPTASLDTTRRQITVTVPHGSWNPTGQVVRVAAGTGLWNSSTGAYITPTQNPTATQPGGAIAPNAAALFNVAFRFDEPWPEVQSPNAIADPAWWRDNDQAHALASGDISQFFANVDFNKLAAATDDDMPGQPGGVPQTGPMNRILASHFETEQGANYAVGCENPITNCKGWFRGQLQPYAIYVPDKPQPPGGYGMTLLLHSLGANYNQFADSANQSQFGERGPGSIVITSEARGPDAWYYDHGGADVFEVWADVAARYQLDADWTAIAGYSMGGYATYKFTTQFPDLFAKAQPTVGPPGEGIWVPPADPQPGGAQSNTNRMLASVRNIPFLIWNGTEDELVPVAGAQAQAAKFQELGYRYEWDLFGTADHFALAINDSYGPAASFLGTTKVDRNPAHVTYAYNPTMDFPDAGTAAGHAYWVSDLALRDASGSAPLGTIDVRSDGFGVGDPAPSGQVNGAGVLTGGQVPAMAYASQTQTWGAAPSAPVADRLHITATNISTVTIDARRARVSCNPQLIIDSDGPLDVKFENCGYARPQAATPLSAPLTIAYKPCSSPDRMHAAPMSFGSCSSPQQSSDQLTVGTPDANGRPAQAVGSLRYRVTGGDVQLNFSMTDVRRRSDLSDYTGELQATQALRITDRANGPSGADTGTLVDTSFPVTVPCAATQSTIGATCELSTSVNSVLPGAVASGNRAVWELGQIRVTDGGADGLAATGPNTDFLTQGLFVP